MKLYLDVSDDIQTNEYTKYASCGLYQGSKLLEFFVNAILFHDEKRSLLKKQQSLLW